MVSFLVEDFFVVELSFLAGAFSGAVLVAVVLVDSVLVVQPAGHAASSTIAIKRLIFMGVLLGCYD